MGGRRVGMGRMDGATADAVPHGGSLEEAGLRFPAAPRPLIDLSTGINPVPYPLAPPTAAAITRLPEPGALRLLQQRAALAYGAADPAMVVAAPGTQLLISLLPHLLPQSAVGVLEPTYAEHAAAWRGAGAAVHPAASLADLVRHPAAVLCNPNNPDGRRHDPAALLAVAARLRLLVVDEAFADFEPGVSLVPHLAAAAASAGAVVVLRSFGKAYGLAGLRLGFAVAAPGLAARLRAALGPWAVSGPALGAGLQALADPAWHAGAARRLRADAARLDALLAAAGCRLLGGTALFRLVAARPGMADALGRRGVIVRTWAARPGVLRFGIPAPADWDRVAAALHAAKQGTAGPEQGAAPFLHGPR